MDCTIVTTLLFVPSGNTGVTVISVFTGLSDYSLEDNIKYLHEAKRNGTTYLYLSNVDDIDDTLIRKSSSEDETLFIPLESEEEFELACLLLFRNKKDA